MALALLFALTCVLLSLCVAQHGTCDRQAERAKTNCETGWAVTQIVLMLSFSAIGAAVSTAAG